MNDAIQKISSVVEFDWPALMRAVSFHLMVGATLLALEPHRIELDPMDELPASNTVPVKVDDVERQFEIYLVLLDTYCGIDKVVLVSSSYNADGTRKSHDYVMYKDFGGQPQVIIRVQSEESYDQTEQEHADQRNYIFQELYSSS